MKLWNLRNTVSSLKKCCYSRLPTCMVICRHFYIKIPECLIRSTQHLDGYKRNSLLRVEYEEYWFKHFWEYLGLYSTPCFCAIKSVWKCWWFEGCIASCVGFYWFYVQKYLYQTTIRRIIFVIYKHGTLIHEWIK